MTITRKKQTNEIYILIHSILPLSNDYDLALVKLDYPVVFNDHVGPACFPEESDNLDEEFDQSSVCVVTGWGTIDPEGLEYGSVLKEDQAQLYSLDRCRELEGDVTDRMLCAGLSSLVHQKSFITFISGHRMTGLEDPRRCQTLGSGDSGGPLVCKHSDRWYHLGAVSWGNFCLEDRLTPGFYASTISMRDWVIETLDANTSVWEVLEDLLRNDSAPHDQENRTRNCGNLSSFQCVNRKHTHTIKKENI